MQFSAHFEPLILLVSISGQTVVFTDELDPTCVRSLMSGKLLRYVVSDGEHVEKGAMVAEMEVMKMYYSISIVLLSS